MTSKLYAALMSFFLSMSAFAAALDITPYYAKNMIRAKLIDLDETRNYSDKVGYGAQLSLGIKDDYFASLGCDQSHGDSKGSIVILLCSLSANMFFSGGYRQEAQHPQVTVSMTPNYSFFMGAGAGYLKFSHKHLKAGESTAQTLSGYLYGPLARLGAQVTLTNSWLLQTEGRAFVGGSSASNQFTAYSVLAGVTYRP